MTAAEKIADILKQHRPSRWRSFTTEEEVLRCCGQDFGPVSKKRKRDDPTSYDLWAVHVAAELASAVESAMAAGKAEAEEKLGRVLAITEMSGETKWNTTSYATALGAIRRELLADTGIEKAPAPVKTEHRIWYESVTPDGRVWTETRSLPELIEQADDRTDLIFKRFDARVEYFGASVEEFDPFDTGIEKPHEQ